MPNLVIKGFKNQEEVNEFINWYVEQGEQDFGLWLECNPVAGVRDFIGCDAKKTYPLKTDDETTTMYLEEE